MVYEVIQGEFGYRYVKVKRFNNTTYRQSIIVEIPTVVLHQTGTTRYPYIVKEIGDRAFYNPANTPLITNLIIGDSVTKIGQSAFQNLNVLTTLTLSNSLKTIGVRAFYGCTALRESLVFPITLDTIGAEAFMNSFDNNSNPIKITIQKNVTSIGDRAFKTANIDTLTIDNALVTINKEAFYQCTSLKQVKTGLLAKSIGASAFENCITLTTVQIAPCVETIGDNAFKNCRVLRVSLPSSGFQYTGLVPVYIPVKLRVIGNSAFEGCGNDSRVTLLFPSTLDTIGDRAFYNTRVDSIHFNDNLKYIGSYAFYRGKFGSVVIPEGVTEIKDGTFEESTVTNIVTGNGVTRIGNRVFAASNLRSIEIGNAVTDIVLNAFDSCEFLRQIKVGSSNTVYDSRNECNAIIETSTNTLLLGTPLTRIENTINTIKSGAFANKYSPQITSINIPVAVTNIEQGAFRGCYNIDTIIVASDNTVYDSRNNCNAIIEKQTNKLILGSNHAYIPNTVTTIGDSAFSNCSRLKKLVVPKTVTTIGYHAFIGAADSTEFVFLQDDINKIPTITVINNDYKAFKENHKVYVPSEMVDNYKTYWVSHRIANILPLANVGLRVGEWNFIVGMGNEANYLNTNYILSPKTDSIALYADLGFPRDWNYEGASEFRNCELTVTGYDYDVNNWSTTYHTAGDTMTLGAGYFVWPYKENRNGVEVTNDGDSIQLHKYLKSGQRTKVTYTTKPNLGNTQTGVVKNGYWYSFGNPFDEPIRVGIASGNTCATCSNLQVSTNGVQGDKQYVFAQGEWTEKDLGENIRPGQGFMVALPNNNHTITFVSNYPILTGEMSLPRPRLEAEDVVSNDGIKFTVNANETTSFMYAKQMEEAQDGFDIKDAYIMFSTNENKVEPYFVVENNAIKHNRYKSDNYSCEVNFRAYRSGVAQLSVSDVPAGTTVSIVDLVTNAETVLEDNVFEFDVHQGENSDRYLIKIVKNGASSLNQVGNTESNISIWNNNEEIFVKGENLQRVEIYNTLGQMVYQREVSGEAYNFTFDNEGAYVVKAICTNGTKSQKVIIK